MTRAEKEAKPSKADLIINYVNAVSLDDVYVNGTKMTRLILAMTLLCMVEPPTLERQAVSKSALKNTQAGVRNRSNPLELSPPRSSESHAL